ncbi:hypothetical protein AB0J65_28340, partial [Streptomyces toxytricini]
RGRAPGAVDRLANRYVGRLVHTATGDHTVTRALTQVMTLRSGVGTLFGPRVLWAAARGPGRPALDGPPLPAAMADLLDRDPLPGRPGPR